MELALNTEAFPIPVVSENVYAVLPVSPETISLKVFRRALDPKKVETETLEVIFISRKRVGDGNHGLARLHIAQFAELLLDHCFLTASRLRRGGLARAT